MDLLFLLFFCEAHSSNGGAKGESQLLLDTPHTAITVLFLVTQVRFWSLLLHCKHIYTHTHTQTTSLKTWDRRRENPTASLLGFEEGFFFLPLEGDVILFTGTFKAPHLWGGASSGQVPLQQRLLREPELFICGGWKFTVSTAGLSAISEKYWVLRVGTEGINFLNP